MKFRAPADVFLRRAQVILILVALVPTMLTTPIGIVLLVSRGGSGGVSLVAGILVLAFCASSLTGFILGSIFLRRGASLVRVQTDFLSSVSHELRTPMTSIRMFIEALLDDRLIDPDERKQCLGVLRREVARLDGLVDRLIELSRIESGRQPFELTPTDAQQIVDDAIDALEAIELGTETAVDLDVDVEPGLRVVADQSAMTQALVNLLSNAWKYGGDPRRIRLLVRSAGERTVEFSVQDNGPGVPADEQNRIFDKFERGRSAAEGGLHGSGLGLSIVRAIARAHHGRVELESAPQRGSCFRIFIPKARV